MPSDCQCSTACEVETRTITKVLNNKEATRLLRKLKEENAELKAQNALLKRSLENHKVSKKKIINKLKKQLDNM